MVSSYTWCNSKELHFFKTIRLSKSNGKKKTLINANILIDLIYYLLFNTFHTYIYIYIYIQYKTSNSASSEVFYQGIDALSSKKEVPFGLS